MDAQKRELKTRKKASSTGNTPADTMKAVANYLSGTALEFVKTQILMSNRKGKGRRYSKPTRRLALSIYFRNSRTCAFLRKIFALPSRRMLRNYVNNYRRGIGTNIWKIARRRTESAYYHWMQWRSAKVSVKTARLISLMGSRIVENLVGRRKQ